MNKKSSDNLYPVILRSTSAVLLLLSLLVIFVAALYIYNTKGGIISLRQLSYKFHLSALSAFALALLLYTPLSYGISFYFLRSAGGNASFSDLFFLLKLPKLLVKATLTTMLKRIYTLLLRLTVLSAALFTEFALMHLMLSNRALLPVLTLLSVFQWMSALVLLLFIKIRYIFCKYALICYPFLSPIACCRLARDTVKGKYLEVLRFYLKYLSVYTLSLVSFGKLSPRTDNSFSVFAVKTLVKHTKRPPLTVKF